MYGNVPYLERLKAVDPAVPAEQGEEATATPYGSQPGEKNEQKFPTRANSLLSVTETTGLSLSNPMMLILNPRKRSG